MFEEIRHLVHAQPFRPFAIYMANGQVFHVPTIDHIAISPTGKRVVVIDDRGLANILSVILVNHLSADEESAERAA